MLLQAVFVGIAVLVSQPFQCFSHPYGRQSLYMFPEVPRSDARRRQILALSATVILAFVLPFVATCLLVTFLFQLAGLENMQVDVLPSLGASDRARAASISTRSAARSCRVSSPARAGSWARPRTAWAC